MFKMSVLCALILLSLPTYARWETVDEAETQFVFLNRNIDVKADGTYEEIFEQKIEILNEGGRSQYESMGFYYNETSEKIQILEAKSISAEDGKEHPVPLDHLEDKPIASMSGGFDQTRQIKIAFANLRVKDMIYVKSKLTVRKVILKGYHQQSYQYGEDRPMQASNIVISSAIPLLKDIADKENYLDFSEEKKGNKFIYHLKLKRPICKRTNEANILPRKLATRVSLSSAKSHAELAGKFAEKYEAVLREPLPKLYADIVDKAKLEADDVAKMNRVMSMLADRVNYLGDWRTVEGQMVPRPLKKVAETGVGDCKDFSAATVVMLRVMGYEAYPATVLRTFNFLEPDTDLATMWSYNHAILMAKNKDGKVFWLDPTNVTAMADGIYPDIEGRPSMVLDIKNPRLEQIPNIDEKHAVTIREFVLERVGKTGIKETGKYELLGECAADFAGLGLRLSSREIEDRFVSMLTGETTVLDRKIKLPDLKQRIVKPLTFEYEYQKNNMMASTSLGDAVHLGAGLLAPLIYAPEDQVGARDLGVRSTFVFKRTLKNFKVSQLDRLNKTVTSPWLDATRKATKVGNDIVIEDDYVFKRNHIFGDEVHSDEYKKVVDELRTHFESMKVIDESNFGG